MAQKEGFRMDQESAVELTAQLITQGISSRVKLHAKTLKERAERLKNAENDKANAGVRQAARRQERALAREKRAKEQAKAKIRDEVRRLLIEKGQVVTPMVSSELLEIHGNFERGKQFLSAIGGQL